MPFNLNFNNNNNQDNYDSNSIAIKSKLQGLGIHGFKLEPKISGPIVTGYPITLHPSTPIKKLMNLGEDIAIACGTDEKVDIRRIGSQIVFYIPNKERKIIDFKDGLNWYLTNPNVAEQNLPILLGVNTVGEFATIDLAEQPHLLIAGSTGSGKSIFQSNIIGCLGMRLAKEDLQFYLVDTKRVDLTQYASMPHVKEVVEDIQDWYTIIDVLIGEVQRRLKLFKEAKVRNIFEFNISDTEIHGKEGDLPYIILMIDEYSDLTEHDDVIRRMEGKIHANPSVDDSLRRLTQISRAAGIHVILCTQRTSVDIVSGVIKSNFPARISLRLPTGHDSKTILGTNGAENLLGKGDLLFKASDSNELRRYHAPFVRLEDIHAVLNQREMILESLYKI